MRSRLTEADLAAWAAYARTVRPLPGSAALPPQPQAVTASMPAPATMAVRPSPRHARPPAPITVGLAPGGLDRATWERFRAGDVGPVRRLDLHGHTAAAAHEATNRFILGAHAAGVRAVEIVTGRGGALGSGVIRRELPHWLAAPHLAPLILAAVHPGGNPGATRLLLRRRRDRAA